MTTSTRVPARSTSVELLDVEVGSTFVSEHHSQGAVRVPGRYLGLRSGDDLVAVAQFVAPRTPAKAREYGVEWVRLAFAPGVRVVGGASKLFRHYVREYAPADVFTYQDTTGEAGDVYLHCGMTLVGSTRRKEYLVAPGHTLETASRREALSVAYAVRFGPDRILGTRLGEVLRSDGTRKSNRDLFLDELGWHVETTTGDRVYEWVNPDVTFYTYRVTAADSEKYYYGTSHVKRSAASAEECAVDGYYGSGGAKYQNWLRAHGSLVEKTVTGVFARKSEAYEHEQVLVGQLYRTDPLCLNSTAGGEGRFAVPALYTTRTCSTHGDVVHMGSSCRTCSAQRGVALRECPTHGVVKHRGDSCVTCVVRALITVGECPVHGEAVHQGGVCTRCVSARSWSVEECATHGATAHQAGVCQRCAVEAFVLLRECPVHGVVKHRGGSCATCASRESWSERECSVHGVAWHHGEACQRCVAGGSWSIRTCPEHGETEHNGGTCQRCLVGSSWAVATCPTHGESPHHDGVCRACRNEGVVSLRSCPTHGVTKHRGTTCARCSSDAAWSIVECLTHGSSKHVGGTCSRCTSESLVRLDECSTHGSVKHRAKVCMTCVSEKGSGRRRCAVHGEETRHKGDTCMRCAVLARWHRKGAHETTPHAICAECRDERG